MPAQRPTHTPRIHSVLPVGAYKANSLLLHRIDPLFLTRYRDHEGGREYQTKHERRSGSRPGKGELPGGCYRQGNQGGAQNHIKAQTKAVNLGANRLPSCESFVAAPRCSGMQHQDPHKEHDSDVIKMEGHGWRDMLRARLGVAKSTEVVAPESVTWLSVQRPFPSWPWPSLPSRSGGLAPRPGNPQGHL